MTNNHESLFFKAYAFQQDHGYPALQDARSSALRDLLVDKGVFTKNEFDDALSKELDSLNAEGSEQPRQSAAETGVDTNDQPAKIIRDTPIKRLNIWRVVQFQWNGDMRTKYILLVEAASAAEAAVLSGERDGLHEIESIENLGPVVARQKK